MTPSLVERRRTDADMRAYHPGIARIFNQVMDDVLIHDRSFADQDHELYQHTYSLRNHLARVGITCDAMARALHWGWQDVDLARVSGQAHDLGKIEKVCEMYRLKRPLTQIERQLVSLHPGLSAEKVQALKPRALPEDHLFLDEVSNVVRCHHKPYWLLDERLRRIAYCVKIGDAWITMQEDRGYNVVRGPIEAYDELKLMNFIELESDAAHLPYLSLMEKITEAIATAFIPAEVRKG